MEEESSESLGKKVPEYGLEALVSTIEDRDELVSAIKRAQNNFT
jgi:hypothetical protein